MATDDEPSYDENKAKILTIHAEQNTETKGQQPSHVPSYNDEEELMELTEEVDQDKIIATVEAGQVVVDAFPGERRETLCGTECSKNYWIVCIGILLVVVAVAVGATVALSWGGGDGDDGSSEELLIANGVSGAGTTPATTPAQVEQSSSAPSATNVLVEVITPSPTPLPIVPITRFEDFVGQIGPTLAPGGDTSLLTNPGTREYEALNWLANSDPANLPMHTDKRILVERYTLALLYFSTGGASWMNQCNFLSADTVCNWNDRNDKTEQHGVFCTGYYVNEISMPENNIQGPFPPEIGLLDRLQYLNFDSNSFTGTLPKQLFALNDLISFQVFGNAFSGIIPKGIGDLSSLAHLDLTANILTGIVPPDIGRLVDLQHLFLGSNRLRGQLPSELGLLTNLVELYLHDNRFSGVVPMSFSNLINLNGLELETNRFTGGLVTLFCNRDDLDVFTADCTAHCNCCTACSE